MGCAGKKRVSYEGRGNVGGLTRTHWCCCANKKSEQKKREFTSRAHQRKKYDHILETFTEKLVEEPARIAPMPQGQAPNGMAPLPPWMAAGPSTPSVALTLSGPPGPSIPWLQPPTDQGNFTGSFGENSSFGNNNNGGVVFSELGECLKELEERQKAWAAHRKEAAWRLRRVELQLEAEKANRKREKAEEVESKVRMLREEEKASLERIEAEYREQLAALRREAEVKEQKLAEQWAAKHSRLAKFLEQAGVRSAGGGEANGR